jgi:homoserine O-acetyltransferase/O-succinyltransferase
MRSTIAVAAATLMLASAGAGAQRDSTTKVHDPAVHTFHADTFAFESGVKLPDATIVYATYGHLDAARDNAVLVPSHYMADHHGYDWLLGPGQALDTARHFVIATEMFGNGHSSSPSNTLEPYHGPRFPAVTIRDNVRIVHQLLVDSLHLTHVEAIVGFSMGAEQAFQWAVSYPEFASRIVATSGTAKCYPHGVVRLEGQISALEADAAFQDGDYASEPRRGMQAYGTVWAGWLFSQAWWREELWRSDTSSFGRTADEVLAGIVRQFTDSIDANDMILQARVWEHHDVGTTPGFGGDVAAALRSISVPVLYMPSETDLYFPIGDAEYERQFIRQVTFAPIHSLWGHPAGAGASPADLAFLNRTIAAFLAVSSSTASVPPAPARPSRQFVASARGDGSN